MANIFDAQNKAVEGGIPSSFFDAPALVAPGTYSGIIVRSDAKYSQEKGSFGLNVAVDITEGELEGSRVFGYVYVGRGSSFENVTVDAGKAFAFNKLVRSCGILDTLTDAQKVEREDGETYFLFSPESFLNLRVGIVVAHEEYNGTTSAKIKSFVSVDSVNPETALF